MRQCKQGANVVLAKDGDHPIVPLYFWFIQVRTRVVDSHMHIFHAATDLAVLGSWTQLDQFDLTRH